MNPLTESVQPRLASPPALSNRVRVALLALLCVASAWIGVVAGRPFVLARQMREENARIERRNADVRMETQRLRKDAAALRTDGGMEREARRLGYMKPGEAPLLVP